jgi:hypothetical protein
MFLFNPKKGDVQVSPVRFACQTSDYGARVVPGKNTKTANIVFREGRVTAASLSDDKRLILLPWGVGDLQLHSLPPGRDNKYCTEATRSTRSRYDTGEMRLLKLEHLGGLAVADRSVTQLPGPRRIGGD